MSQVVSARFELDKHEQRDRSRYCKAIFETDDKPPRTITSLYKVRDKDDLDAILAMRREWIDGELVREAQMFADREALDGKLATAVDDSIKAGKMTEDDARALGVDVVSTIEAEAIDLGRAP